MQVQPSVSDDDRLMSLVDAALVQPPDEREAWLRHKCGGDSRLFDQAREYIQSEERMGGFLLKPFCTLEVFDPVLEPGELLKGRFRIERQVGEGGMAIVYEAFDETLKKRIAVKCAKAGFDTRLTPEVRHATEIAHDNVCKIWDFHSAGTDRGEIDFITMEFLDGPTLTDRLAEGPLPEREARAIARQLCAGLAAAHRNQVIHGDLKSNNIILTKAADGSLRAVITDFGLARASAAGMQRDGPGPGESDDAVGGARDYMAPELRNGEKPSAASDIYALGCICYEMLSGIRLRDPGAPGPDSPARKQPRVHPRWNAILGRCLDPDPARRYRSVKEIEKALTPISRPLMLAVAAGVVLAAVTGGVTYFKTITPPETVRLAVLPFETDAANRALSDGLLNETAERLREVKSSRASRLTVIPLADAMRNKVNRVENAAGLLGATHVLTGTLRQDKGNTEIHASLTDAHSHVPLREWKAEYAPNELRDAPVALAGIVTRTLRLPPLAASATVAANAYVDFSKGVGLLQRNRPDEALPLLEKAVEEDPASPLTNARLAEAQIQKYWSIKEVQGVGGDDWLEKARASLSRAELRNPDLAVVRGVSGMVNEYSGLYDDAEEDYQRALEIEPLNGDFWRRRGDVYQKTSRFPQALLAYQKAIEVQPGYFMNYQALCNLYADQANNDEAVRQCQKMVALVPGSSEAHYLLSKPYLASGSFSAGERELRQAVEIDPTSSKSLHALALSLVYQRRYSEAIPFFRRAVDIGPENEVLYQNFGTTLGLAGLPQEAHKAYGKALTLAEAELRRNPRNRKVRSHFAYLCARLGQRSRAESEAEQALRLSSGDVEVARMIVLTYDALGESDRALELAEKLPDEMLRRLNRSPELADLPNNPRFQQLMHSRHIQ
jgi:serine/threonine-protein kinase